VSPRTYFEHTDSLAQLGICLYYVPKAPAERGVRIFKNGRNQAVCIHREFQLPGNDAIMREEGERLIIEPVPAKSLLAVLAELKPLQEEFPPIPDPAPDAVEL
jgi:antitoxin VapB